MAAFTSEWWPPSFRNGGRLQAGIPGRIESESALQSLPELPKLAELLLRGNGVLTDAGDLSRAPVIEQLDIRGNPKLDTVVGLGNLAALSRLVLWVDLPADVSDALKGKAKLR